VVAARALFAADAPPLPRALATVAEERRVAALIFLLSAPGRLSAEIVAQDGGLVSKEAVSALVRWISEVLKPKSPFVRTIRVDLLL
jgi:hypothetical protein